MGITSPSLHRLKRFIDEFHPEIVIDLGAQNLFLDRIHPSVPDILRDSKKWIESMGFPIYNESLAGEPETPKPFASQMWKYLEIEYYSIDVNKRNDSIDWDLGQPLQTAMKFDFVMDYGTGEHIMSLYQLFANCDDLCRIGGLMFHENPKTGSWPDHGFHYFTQGFYIDLAKQAGYNIIDIGEQAAFANQIDGWNVYAILQKTKEGFISKDKFPKTLNK